MRIRTRLYDNQFVICHFSLTENEKKKRLSEIVDKSMLKDEIYVTNYLYKVIGDEIDSKIFKEYTYITVGKKDIFFLLNEEDKPLLGVARCVCLPYISKLVLPKEITEKDYSLFLALHTDEALLSILHGAELVHEFYLLKKVDVVDEFSVIDFELNAYRNEKLIDVQTFNNYCIAEGPFDDNIFIGHKFNDVIPLDLKSKVRYEIHIKKVNKIVFYDENEYDREKLSMLGYNDYLEYREDMFRAFIRYDAIEFLSNFILEFSASNSDLSLSQLVVDFYSEKAYIPFEKKNNNPKKKQAQLQKVYLLEIFNKMILINDDGSLSMNKKNSGNAYNYVIDYLTKINFGDQKGILTDEIDYEIMKYKFLEYCDNEGIIKGIKFKY